MEATKPKVIPDQRKVTNQLVSSMTQRTLNRVKNYQTDCAHDIHYLHTQSVTCDLYMWVLRESGTNLCRIDTLGREHFKTYLPSAKDPNNRVYIIDLSQSKVVRTSSEVIEQMYDQYTDPLYRVKLEHQDFPTAGSLLETLDSSKADADYNRHVNYLRLSDSPQRVTLTEVHSGHVIAEEVHSNWQEYPRDVQEKIGKINDYEMVDKLDWFDLVHMYPKRLAYPDGYHDAQFFELVMYNRDTMQRCKSGRLHDALLLDNLPIDRVQVYADGSFLVRFTESVQANTSFQAVDMKGY